MIRFRCQHCGDTVHVQEAHAGHRGRCPACREVVWIPRGGQEALAVGASTTESSGTVAGISPPPPPPASSNDAGEEVDLDSSQGGPASDTVILPALHNAESLPRRRRRRRDPPPPPPHPRDRVQLGSRGLQMLILTLVLLVMIIAATAILLIVQS